MMASECGKWTAWTQGGELFAELVSQYSAGTLHPDALKAAAEVFYSSPALHDWDPADVDPESVLTDEAPVVAMLVQAWSDRAAWAAERVFSEEAQHNYRTSCRVIQGAVKYLPNGTEVAE
jgi:hypothetical protein